MIPALTTIGYEGRVQDELLTLLQAHGVATLLDVRAVPLSRKAGFSKRVLAASAAAVGIRYVHIRALGTPKDGRIAARAGRISDMTEIFTAHMRSEAAQAGLAEAIAVARDAPTCLLCFEREACGCHRKIVADMMRGAGAFSVTHI